MEERNETLNQIEEKALSDAPAKMPEENEPLEKNVRLMSPTRMVLRRFFRSKLSIVGLVMIVSLFLFCYGVSLILSALYVFFRDIMHFYNVFLTLWMYLTPIFYNVRIFEQKSNEGNGLASLMETVINLNPMYHFVEYFRDVVYRCSAHEGAIPGLKEQLASATDAKVITSLTAELNSTVAAAQLPGVSDVMILYAIGLGALAVGAAVFMSVKRKFIYSI